MNDFAAENELVIPSNTTCACPDQVLNFNCTVFGGGATVWRGSAFRCQAGEIILRHNGFLNGTTGACNNSIINARSFGDQVENNCFISGLDILISRALNNTTVMCVSNSDSGMVPVGEATILVISGRHFFNFNAVPLLIFTFKVPYLLD